ARRGAPGDRAHPPDPRALPGRAPPARRGPDVRGRPGARLAGRPGAPVAARRAARLRAPADRPARGGVQRLPGGPGARPRGRARGLPVVLARPPGPRLRSTPSGPTLVHRQGTPYRSSGRVTRV